MAGKVPCKCLPYFTDYHAHCHRICGPCFLLVSCQCKVEDMVLLRVFVSLPARRFDLQHAVTASNLFKYCHPAQGVVLFKHHDPLSFSLPQLSDLVSVSHSWFQAAAVAATGKEATGDIQRSYQQQCENGNCGSDEGSSSGTSLGIDTEVRQQEPPPQHGQAGRRGQLHALFLWNCLPRAGWWRLGCAPKHHHAWRARPCAA